MNYQQDLEQLRRKVDQIAESELPEKERLLVDLALGIARIEARILASLTIGWVKK